MSLEKPRLTSVDLSEAEPDRVFDLLSRLSVELDSDPLVYGPGRLNEKIAEVHRCIGLVQAESLRFSQLLSGYQRRYRAAEASYRLAFRDLLANDPHVRMERATMDREARANGKLQPLIEERDRYLYAVQDAEAILAVIRTKHLDLRDSQGRLKDQIRLCHEEISLGGAWGNRLPTAGLGVPGRSNFRRGPAEASPDEIESLLDETLRERDRVRVPAPRSEPETDDAPTVPSPEGDSLELLDATLDRIVDPSTAPRTIADAEILDESIFSFGK